MARRGRPPGGKNRPTANAPVAVADMTSLLTSGLRSSNIFTYRPHQKQIEFHSSLMKLILNIGGNRSGKTMAGCAEDVFRLRGEHPYKAVPPAPVHGRAVCVGPNRIGISEIFLPKLKLFCPPSLLINGSWEDSYSKGDQKLTCANGSTLELMTYDQDVDAFAGTSRHFLHLDEEPPKPVYNECMARLVDTDGDMYLTMTPLLGMTWVHTDLFKPWENGTGKTDVIITDIDDNPYLPVDAVAEFLERIEDPDERKARKSGTFIALGGLAYAKFNPLRDVVSYSPQLLARVRNQDIYMSIDHGYNAPTAVLWHAVDADGSIITFAEHYASKMTVGQHAARIHELEAQMQLPVERITRVGDPSMARTEGVTGTSAMTEYAIKGVFLARGNNKREPGIQKMIDYLTRQKWKIADSCPNLIRELGLARWATYASAKLRYENNPKEDTAKKDDHAPDSARYFIATFMPDLPPEPQGPVAGATANDFLDAKTAAPELPSWNDYLAQRYASGSPAATLGMPGGTRWSYPDDQASLEYD